MTRSTDPSKNVLKNPPPPQIPLEVRSALCNQHINKVTPHFTLMRRAQNADTHALKQPRLSQNISPVCSNFALVITSDMYLESESEK